MTLLSYAKQELDLLGIKDKSKDNPDSWMRDHILKMIEVFEEEGHSGSSAKYAISILTRLLDYKPLTPLTGEESEWMEVGFETSQNRRHYSVFKDQTGTYWSDGIVFWEWCLTEEGKKIKTYFTSRDSRVPIKFPWYPPSEPEYRFRPTKEFPEEAE